MKNVVGHNFEELLFAGKQPVEGVDQVRPHLFDRAHGPGSDHSHAGQRVKVAKNLVQAPDPPGEAGRHLAGPLREAPRVCKDHVANPGKRNEEVCCSSCPFFKLLLN